jgi:hypothetical protein
MAGDPFGLLLRQRIVFLGGEVNDFSADAVISQLLLLDSQAPNKVWFDMGAWLSPLCHELLFCLIQHFTLNSDLAFDTGHQALH